MKNLSLKELNSCGTLLMSFKEDAFVTSGGACVPHYFRPVTCYLHLYNGLYYVTTYIRFSRQFVYSDFRDAVDRFTRFIHNISVQL